LAEVTFADGASAPQLVLSQGRTETVGKRID
jgi:hypothetical protein